MNLPARLLSALTLTTVLFTAGVWGGRTFAAPKAAPNDLGLRWLKEHYHLDEPTFSQVAELHRSYFARCGTLCRRLTETSRPLQWPPPHRGRDTTDREALRLEQRELCTECERRTQEHLHRVAALLPEGQGPLFLSEFTRIIEAQRRRLGVSP
jgi:hypothetical protein